jgi:hypothetical protein
MCVKVADPRVTVFVGSTDALCIADDLSRKLGACEIVGASMQDFTCGRYFATSFPLTKG